MKRSIGLVVTEHVAAGLVEDNRLCGEVHRMVEEEQGIDGLRATPAEEMVEALAKEAAALAHGHRVEAIKHLDAAIHEAEICMSMK